MTQPHGGGAPPRFIGPRRYERVRFTADAVTAVKQVLIEVTSEDERWLRGYEVTLDGARRWKEGEYDERLQFILKEAIESRREMEMNLTYAVLKPVKKKRRAG